MKLLIQKALIIFLWIAAISLWFFARFPYIFWMLLVLHFAELILVGYRTGRQYGASPFESIIQSMFFGYAWWLPRRRQIKTETFTDADFMRED